MTDSTKLPVSDDLHVTEALSNLLSDLNARLPKNHTHTPTALLSALTSTRFTADADQQDAHEFLLALFDAIRTEQNEELNRQHKAKISLDASTRAIIEQSEKIRSKLLSNATSDDYDYDLPTVFLPFDGLLCTRVLCTRCNEMQSLRHQIFSSIELALPPSSVLSGGSNFFASKASDTATLETMLEAYSEPEVLNQVNCQRCSLMDAHAHIGRLIANANSAISSSEVQLQESESAKVSTAHELLPILAARRDAIAEVLSSPTILDSEFDKLRPPRLVASTKTRQVTLSRAPEALALHINRSEYDMRSGMARKRNTAVVFSERVPVGRFLSSFSATEKDDRLCSEQNEIWYRLMSTVVHFGSHSYGHYISYRRVDEDKWIRVSDRDVRDASLDEVLAQGMVVLLFYEREDAEPEDLPKQDDKFLLALKEKHDHEQVVKSETDVPLFDVHENDSSDGGLDVHSSSSSSATETTHSPPPQIVSPSPPPLSSTISNSSRRRRRHRRKSSSATITNINVSSELSHKLSDVAPICAN